MIMNGLKVPKGKYYPKEILIQKILHSYGYFPDYHIYGWSKSFGNLFYVIIYDSYYFNDICNKNASIEDIDECDTNYILIILIKKEDFDSFIWYRLFEDYSLEDNDYSVFEKSIIKLLKSKSPYIPDNLDSIPITEEVEEVERLYYDKLDNNESAKKELFKKIFKYNKECLEDAREAYISWVKEKEWEEEQRYYENEAYREAYNDDPEAVWNTD